MSWLDELKVGDQVLDGDHLITVTDIHKLYIVCGADKYSKSRGRLVGLNPYYSRYIDQATPERLAEIAEKNERGEMLRYLNRWNFRDFPTGYLRKLVDIIKEYEAELEKENSDD